ncbi:MAG TPA: hypothetical protein VFF06_25035 [Polyangia bacterium]|nr:hypothetical protein [Polyangia bacterium]
MAGPLALSIGVHALLFGTFVVGAHVSWPAPPIPIEIQPAHRPARETANEERRGDPKSNEKPAPVEKTARVPKRPANASTAPSLPKTLPPPATADLRPFAPADANLVVLLRSDKLRKSPHRQNIDELLEALPDYRMLLDGTGLKPIDDFEALLIATADPHDVTATFLAARFRDSPRLRAVTAREVRPGDPRVFRVLAPGLAVLTQPSDAARLDRARAADGGADDPQARWLGELERFDRVARDEGGPAVVVTLSDAPSLVRLGDGLPTPLAVAVALTGDASPSLRLKLVFAGADDAERFEAAWPTILTRWRQRTALLGLAPALDGLKLERTDAQLELQGRVPEAQTRLALAFARAVLPHPASAAPFDGGSGAR